MHEASAFVDFVNTEWLDGVGNVEDRLTAPGWIAEFSARWFETTGRADEASPLRPRDLALLRELRTTLRALLEAAGGGGDVPSEVVERLNHFLATGGLTLRVSATEDGRLELRAVVDIAAASTVAGAVALSAASFLEEGDLRRLKQCANDGCRWAFIDATKNVSRRWCDSRSCGNVDKVRRYRRRRQGVRET